MQIETVLTRPERLDVKTVTPRSLSPLRRRPKSLTEAPTLHEPPSGAAGGGGTSSRRDGRQPAAHKSKGLSFAVTDDSAELLTPELEGQVDSEVFQRAREIAGRLSLARAKHDRTERRGSGLLRSVPYSGSSDEIDVESTLERLIESAPLADQDIIVRERRQNQRSIVLAVDVSGSMSGERARTAAATIGATVDRLGDDVVGVVAFWSDASVLVPLGTPTTPEQVLDQLLQLPSRGLTNVEFPLQVALSQLTRVPARDARVLLLSDCVHNAGPDPRGVAALLPRLDVLLDVSGEHDVDLARDLADLGHGRVALAATYRDVAPALSRLFAQ